MKNNGNNKFMPLSQNESRSNGTTCLDFSKFGFALSANPILESTPKSQKLLIFISFTPYLVTAGNR
jgi:hypothetical protein